MCFEFAQRLSESTDESAVGGVVATSLMLVAAHESTYTLEQEVDLHVARIAETKPAGAHTRLFPRPRPA
jgi:hypothetical protein